MATFSTESQFVDVNKYSNYDYIVCDETRASFSGAVVPLAGDYLIQASGAAGYVYDVSSQTVKLACNTTTVFADGSATFSRSGLILTVTLSNVSTTHGANNRPLSNLADRDEYLKDRIDATDVTLSTKHYIEKRHTVLSGPIDSNGYPDIIKANNSTVTALLHFASTGTLTNSSDSGVTFATVGLSTNFSSVTGKFGDAIMLTGSTSGIKVSSTVMFENYDEWTVETWFKAATFSSVTLTTIFGSADITTPNMYKMLLYISSGVSSGTGGSGVLGQLELSVGDASSAAWDAIIETGEILAVDTWYHFVLSYKSSESKIKLFLDGILIGQIATTDFSVPNISEFSFGNFRFASGAYTGSGDPSAGKYFDETRIILGKAVYWDDDGFNVPTVPYQDTTFVPMGGLQNWYKFDGNGTDEISGSIATVGSNVITSFGKFTITAGALYPQALADGQIDLDANFFTTSTTTEFSWSGWTYWNVSQAGTIRYTSAGDAHYIRSLVSRGYAGNVSGTLTGHSIHLLDFIEKKEFNAIGLIRGTGINNDPNDVYNGGTLYTQAISGQTGISTANSGWHHIAYTFKNGLAKLYFDGNLVASATMPAVSYSGFPFTTDQGNFEIGRINSNEPEGIAAINIDQMRKYNTQLTDEEIQHLYQEGLSGLSGLYLNTSEPIIGAIANGYSAQTGTGALDYIFQYNQEKTFNLSDFQNGNHYVYAEYNTSDASVTIGTTLSPPQYNYKVFGYDSGFIRLNAAEANVGALEYTDKFNVEVDLVGGASIGINPSTGDKNFFTNSDSSWIQMPNPIKAAQNFGDGTWEMEFIVNSGTISAYPQYVLQDAKRSTAETDLCYGIIIAFQSNNSLYFQLGTNHSSATGSAYFTYSTSVATISNNQDIHFKVSHDRTHYRLFMDGEVVTIGELTLPVVPANYLRLNQDDQQTASYYGFDYVKWFVARPYITSTQSFVAPTLCPDVTFDYFSIPKMKMYDANTNTQVYRLYIGEFNIQDGEIVDTITYAYNGKYISDIFYISNSNLELEFAKNHNIGTSQIEFYGEVKNSHGAKWVIDSGAPDVVQPAAGGYIVRGANLVPMTNNEIRISFIKGGEAYSIINRSLINDDFTDYRSTDSGYRSFIAEALYSYYGIYRVHVKRRF